MSAALCCATAAAHVISMSNGYATVSGKRVDYILRMPDYEMPRSADPAPLLLDRIRFSSGFETARRMGGECHHDAADSVFLCAAAYVFTEPPADLNVECTFFDVTVPNHIHMLHAERAGQHDQAILDSSFSSAPLRFRAPTAFEQAAMQSLAAARKTFTTWPHTLLLLALALAARNRRELAGNAAAFAAGQCIVCLLLLRSVWQPPPAFAEAAVALALAYLAFEMLFFPRSGWRWPIAALLGAFSGSYFANFITEAGFRPEYVLSGSAAAAFMAVLLAFLIFYPARKREWIARAASVPLLLAGLIWFAIRLRNG